MKTSTDAPSLTAAEVDALRHRGELARAQQAAEQALPTLPADQRGEMLLALAHVHATRGATLQSLRAAVAAHECCQLAGQVPGAVRALVAIAQAMRLSGDHATAVRTLEQAETLLRGLDLPLEMAALLRTLGVSSSVLGRHQHAMSCLAEASELFAAHGLPADVLNARMSWLNARSRHGDSLHGPEREARLHPLLDEWRRLAQECVLQGQRVIAVKAEGNLAITWSMLGRHAEAAQALQALRPQYAELGLRPNEGLCLGELARCQLALDDAIGARDSALQAIALLEDGNVDDLREAYEQLSAAEERLSNHAKALAALKRVLELQRRQREHEARAALQQRELRIELARLTDQWAREATLDPLTGLANRRGLDQWLGRHWPRVEEGAGLVLLLMDLDHFKRINDGFGHGVGDIVLQRVAEQLRPLCRSLDLAVRYGGEEFLLALADLSVPEAESVAERVRTALAAQDWEAVAAGLRVTVSIGVASAHEVADVQALFVLADRRLYAAKLGGRDRVVAEG
jgi:diguanylate cyclase